MQQSIFDLMYEKYKIKTPIKTIELFGGYGSQFLSLKYIGANATHHKLVEWASKSIQAYNDLHIQDYTDYSKEMSNEEVLQKVYEMGVSLDYNQPATKEQLARQDYRKIYNNIIATDNLVDVSRVKGKDLEINDKEHFTYLLTYSFPCQDLSLAGKQKGMSDTSTRSGLLWEVERILKECKEINQLPQVLLMENVPQVHSQDNSKDFIKWQQSLEEMGYKNYWQDMIATDYGIPQTRNRCFMISILGNYSYQFPKPIQLKLKLKDLLEDNVDKKYYITAKQIEDIKNWNAFEKPLENMEKNNKTNIAPTLTTRSGAYAAGMILIKENEESFVERKYRNFYEENGYVPNMFNPYNEVEIKENIPTLTTQCGSSTSSSACLIKKNTGIRKITPKEAFRLMGVKDEDFEKIQKNQIDSSLYHLAGDSIVTNCLQAIFKELL